jgi:hypothetical protein
VVTCSPYQALTGSGVPMRPPTSSPPVGQLRDKRLRFPPYQLGRPSVNALSCDGLETNDPSCLSKAAQAHTRTLRSERRRPSAQIAFVTGAATPDATLRSKRCSRRSEARPDETCRDRRDSPVASPRPRVRKPCRSPERPNGEVALDATVNAKPLHDPGPAQPAGPHRPR